MIDHKIEEVLNQQIQNKLNCAYLYLSMSIYFKRIQLEGLSQWLRCQYENENKAVICLIDHLVDREGIVELPSLFKPPINFGSPLQTLEELLENEKKMTCSYNEVMGLAHNENDYQTFGIIQTFLGSQINKEASCIKMIKKLENIKKEPNALLILDQELIRNE